LLTIFPEKMSARISSSSSEKFLVKVMNDNCLNTGFHSYDEGAIIHE